MSEESSQDWRRGTTPHQMYEFAIVVVVCPRCGTKLGGVWWIPPEWDEHPGRWLLWANNLDFPATANSAKRSDGSNLGVWTARTAYLDLSSGDEGGDERFRFGCRRHGKHHLAARDLREAYQCEASKLERPAKPATLRARPGYPGR